MAGTVLQEEGLILKNPDSEWKPDDRRLGSWVKLKPEYTREYEVRSGAAHQPSRARSSCILARTTSFSMFWYSRGSAIFSCTGIFRS